METASAQPLRATASAPVELRSAQHFHPVRRGHRYQGTTLSQALPTCYTGSTWGLYKIVSSTFAILLFPSLDLQLVTTLNES
jgi:hypothetical protein